MFGLRQICAVFASVAFLAHGAPEPMVSIADCTFVPTPWADGDSFLIRKPDGSEMTVRLYGADCVEWHVSDDTDARRLRAQRRYFAITSAKSTPQASIQFARSLGEQAASFTAQQLQAPFTVHTRMQGAPGDGKHQRYYAFVETSDGKDLATELVRAGLARAHGVTTDGPGERSRERYQEILSDIELQSAKRGHGIWAFTDWEKLPSERDTQRIEDEEDQLAQGRQPLPATFRINPNTASRDDLNRLPGIGDLLADRIIEVRADAPFREADDLKRVPGIKEKSLDRIREYLAF